MFQLARQVPREGSHCLFHLVQLIVIINRRKTMTHYLQVDLLIVMGMGDSKGLGDPGMEGVLLKLAHPRRDIHDMSHE